MNTINRVLSAAAISSVLAVAQATPMDIGGVVFDPNDPFDWSGTTATIHQDIASTGIVSGYGTITTLNNHFQSSFCPGCELTIQFGGYTPGLGVPLPSVIGGGTTINYTGGFVKLFVDTSQNTNGGLNITSGNTGDGILWLGMIGHGDPAHGFATLTGVNNFPTSLLGTGLLDVIPGMPFGGLASAYMDTNTRALGADISFTNSFTNFSTGTPLNADGSGNFKGDALALPEPASFWLFGAGLVSLAMLRRRQMKG